MKIANTPIEGRVMPLNIPYPQNSPEWLRSFKGCEHYSDSESLEILNALDAYAKILLKTASELITNIDNQQVVPLISQNETKKLAA